MSRLGQYATGMDTPVDVIAQTVAAAPTEEPPGSSEAGTLGSHGAPADDIEFISSKPVKKPIDDLPSSLASHGIPCPSPIGPGLIEPCRPLETALPDLPETTHTEQVEVGKLVAPPTSNSATFLPAFEHYQIALSLQTPDGSPGRSSPPMSPKQAPRRSSIGPCPRGQESQPPSNEASTTTEQSSDSAYDLVFPTDHQLGIRVADPPTYVARPPVTVQMSTQLPLVSAACTTRIIPTHSTVAGNRPNQAPYSHAPNYQWSSTVPPRRPTGGQAQEVGYLGSGISVGGHNFGSHHCRLCEINQQYMMPPSASLNQAPGAYYPSSVGTYGSGWMNSMGAPGSSQYMDMSTTASVGPLDPNFSGPGAARGQMGHLSTNTGTTASSTPPHTVVKGRSPQPATTTTAAGTGTSSGTNKEASRDDSQASGDGPHEPFPTTRPGKRKHSPNLIVDIAETCEEVFPAQAIAERHKQPVEKVVEAFQALVQFPLLQCATDRRRAGKLGTARMRDYQKAKRDFLVARNPPRPENGPFTMSDVYDMAKTSPRPDGSGC